MANDTLPYRTSTDRLCTVKAVRLGMGYGDRVAVTLPHGNFYRYSHSIIGCGAGIDGSGIRGQDRAAVP